MTPSAANDIPALPFGAKLTMLDNGFVFIVRKKTFPDLYLR